MTNKEKKYVQQATVRVLFNSQTKKFFNTNS